MDASSLQNHTSLIHHSECKMICKAHSLTFLLTDNCLETTLSLTDFQLLLPMELLLWSNPLPGTSEALRKSMAFMSCDGSTLSSF